MANVPDTKRAEDRSATPFVRAWRAHRSARIARIVEALSAISMIGVLAGCTCGAVREPCCNGGTCNAGLQCIGGTCCSPPHGGCASNADCCPYEGIVCGSAHTCCASVGTSCASNGDCCGSLECRNRRCQTPCPNPVGSTCSCAQPCCQAPAVCSLTSSQCGVSATATAPCTVSCVRSGSAPMPGQSCCAGLQPLDSGGRCCTPRMAAPPPGETCCGADVVSGGVCVACTPVGSSCSSVPCCGAGGDVQCCGGTPATGPTCVDTTRDVRNCGACGHVCPGDPNGTATCTAGHCDVACNAGFHTCGSIICVPTNDVTNCGTNCLNCLVTPPATNPRCTLDPAGVGTCQFDCLPGTHLCGGSCHLDNDTHACGTSCSACPTPRNGTAYCFGGSCGTNCPYRNYPRCGSECVSILSDPNNCGGCGVRCGAGVSCNRGVCGGMGSFCTDLGGTCTASSDCCSGVCTTSGSGVGACSGELQCQAPGEDCSGGACCSVGAGTPCGCPESGMCDDTCS